MTALETLRRVRFLIYKLVDGNLTALQEVEQPPMSDTLWQVFEKRDDVPGARAFPDNLTYAQNAHLPKSALGN